jgi:L-lactate dehydrogenase complex protein LldG
MTSTREAILAGIRAGLGRKRSDTAAVAELEKRLCTPKRNLVPARATTLDPAGRVALFAVMAKEAQATIEFVPDFSAIPAAVANYLVSRSLPAEIRMAPDPALERLSWQKYPLLQAQTGRAEPGDAVSLTGSFAGIAETGTLMLISGPAHPTTLNFLPETHVVVLPCTRIVATYEDGWDLLRAEVRRQGIPEMARMVNFVTGPSRTADIEQRLQLGAHGPRRLHILLVDDIGASS